MKTIEVRGEYRNPAGYAYRATLPPGLVGYRDPAPAPAHGFVVELGGNPDDRLSVAGEYNAAEYPSAQVVADRTLAWVREKADSVQVPAFRPAVLAGLPAVELVVRYAGRATSAERVCRSIATIRRIKPTDTMGIIYEITLDTTAQRLGKDAAIYSSVVKSFRLDPLDHY